MARGTLSLEHVQARARLLEQPGLVITRSSCVLAKGEFDLLDHGAAFDGGPHRRLPEEFSVQAQDSCPIRRHCGGSPLRLGPQLLDVLAASLASSALRSRVLWHVRLVFPAVVLPNAVIFLVSDRPPLAVPAMWSDRLARPRRRARRERPSAS